jgi:hypothetical protein
MYVLIPTHTPRYLDLVLAALARQTTRASHIVVSCDNDDPAIGGIIRQWGPRTGVPVWWVRRASTGGERLCQVRNNGVRHLVDELKVTSGRLLVLDGDMIAPDGLVEAHARVGREAPLVYPYRVNVDRERSEALTAEGLLAGGQQLSLSPQDLAALAQRDARYRRQLLMRRLHLGPLHKPKLLGGHFSVDLALYLELNGFDELYQGWGFKDDEFAHRAARLRAPVRVAVAEIPAWHLWHVTRQPSVPMRELPTARRFADRGGHPVRAERGVRNPLEQPQVAVTLAGR